MHADNNLPRQRLHPARGRSVADKRLTHFPAREGRGNEHHLILV